MKVADIKNVAGIGGGVIGGSWAVLFAMKGLNVKLYDINDDCLANDKKTIVMPILDSLLKTVQLKTRMRFLQESSLQQAWKKL